MNPFLRHATRSPRPFPSLARELQREMNQAMRSIDAAYHGPRGVYPPVNLSESEEGYVLTAELPGVSPEDIDVQIEGATVTLSGQRKVEYSAGDGVAVHRRERQSGNFRRAFELPAEIDFDRARASHKNGVLTLELPKSPALQPRQIEIETR
ncbi:MAG: Hsp20/alpha crystallin family protein [bacterium]|nr:Hsp20/alpha crystallin family protein [bacterium]